MNLKDRAKKLKRDIPAVFLALRDRETPWYAKVAAGLTAAYALSPIDLIPDFIPILGYLDDLLLLPAMVALCVRLIPARVLERCRREADELLPLKKHWFFAVPAVLIWAALLALAIRAALS